MVSQDVTSPPVAATADVRLERAFRLVANPAVAVVSFDVFDTLLFRRVPDPVDAFEVLGERLRAAGLTTVAPRVFRRLRIAAEADARGRRAASGGGPEIVLDEVYAALARARVLGEAPNVGALVQEEVDLERELLVPDLDVLGLLEAAREAGRTVVAVSDTYFTEAQLELLLTHRGVRPDRLFVSSAHGAGKASGLWPIVLDALGVRAEEVLHVGDHEDADGRLPRELGVRTVSFERRDAGLEELLRRERRHLERPVAGVAGDFGMTALRGKVAHRREVRALPEELRPFWRYGAVALGPAFCGFATWVQERAAAVGARRVHCFMREGTLLARLVNAAGDALDGAVHAEPLWLSRQVLARAAIREANAEELARLLVRRSAPTVRGVCATLGLDVARIPKLAPHADGRLDDLGLRDDVLRVLTTDPELRTHIMASGAQARDRVLRYLDRVRGDDEGPLVLVDVGWQGTVQSLLNRVLRAEGIDLHTVGLYLLTHAGAIDKQLAGAEVHGFLGESGEPEEAVAAIIRSPEVLEQVCMPDHGSQVDLTAELQPVLAPAAAESPLQAAERHAVQQGLSAFVREWTRYRLAVPGALPPLGEAAAPLLRAQVARAVTAPTEAEARIFSRWLHDENFGSTSSEAIAGGDAVRALRHLDARTLVDLPMQELYWPFGLAALHDEHLARAAELVATGAASWEAFGSRLETGDVELYVDDGWGFAEARKVSVPGRRNRFGLTYVRAEARAVEIHALRFDPARTPAVVRIDWMVLCARRRDVSDEAVVVLETPERLAALPLRGAHWIGPGLLQATGNDPQLHLDVHGMFGPGVYAVEVHAALALLPTLPPVPGDEELDRRLLAARRSVRRLELRTGLPITPAFRRARGMARRLRG